MAASAEQIAKLRRLTAESDPAGAYSDGALAEHIEANPLPYRDSSTGRVYRPGDTAWVATYDLNAAASDVWDEKAATVANQHDYSVDGSSRSRGQLHEHYVERARYFRARSTPVSVRLSR